MKSRKFILTNYHLSSPMHVLHWLHVLSANKKLHTIAIDLDNYKALRNLGYTGESFNTVIKRLLRATKRKESQARILANDGGTDE